MKIETLIDIGIEIRNAIKCFMEENADYGEMIAERKNDITRKIDMEAEKALNNALLSRDLSAIVISEELGERIIGESPEFMLVFDPIDGSTNAACGIPFFCTSIAYAKNFNATFEDVEMAVICDIQGNIYHAIKEKGAFLNGKKFSKKLGARPKPVVSVYSYGIPHIPSALKELEKSIIVRTLGSIALEMCFVADGTLDGVIDIRGMLSAYDIMASSLVLKEAGGKLTDLRGNAVNKPAKATGISIIATRDKGLHDSIVKLLS